MTICILSFESQKIKCMFIQKNFKCFNVKHWMYIKIVSVIVSPCLSFGGIYITNSLIAFGWFSASSCLEYCR